jgi:hypothetical protein
LATNTVYNPSAQPSVIRVDLPEQGLSIVQVFEYPSVAPSQAEADGMLPASAPAISPFAAKAGADSAPVSFAAALTGLSYDWDSFWLPGGSPDPGGYPVQVRITAGAANDILSTVAGDFTLTRETMSEGVLGLGKGGGTLGLDIGVDFAIQGSIDIEILPPFVFDIPFVPNFDLRIDETAEFDSYLLGSSATVSGALPRATLFNVPLLTLPVVLTGYAKLDGHCAPRRGWRSVSRTPRIRWR